MMLNHSKRRKLSFLRIGCVEFILHLIRHRFDQPHCKGYNVLNRHSIHSIFFSNNTLQIFMACQTIINSILVTKCMHGLTLDHSGLRFNPKRWVAPHSTDDRSPFGRISLKSRCFRTFLMGIRLLFLSRVFTPNQDLFRDIDKAEKF